MLAFGITTNCEHNTLISSHEGLCFCHGSFVCWSFFSVSMITETFMEELSGFLWKVWALQMLSDVISKSYEDIKKEVEDRSWWKKRASEI